MKGTVEKRGDKWRLRVTIGYNENGNPIRESRMAESKLKREAESELAQFISEIESGKYVRPEKMTLEKFVSEWREKYAIDALSNDTLHSYENILKSRILPKYGHYALSDIKTIHIVNFINELKKDDSRLDGKSSKLAPSTINNCFKSFNSVLKCAADWRLIKENPASNIKVPKGKSKKATVYDKEDVAILLEKLQEEPLSRQVMVINWRSPRRNCGS